MAGIEIPGLGRKLRLLIDHGHFENWDELGLAFDRAGSTIQWWGHGNDDRAPGTIPGDRFDTLINVLANCLPGDLTNSDVEHLIHAPVAELETLLNIQAHISLNQLIAHEAIIDAGRLIKKSNLGLIETDQAPVKPKPKFGIGLGEWFRVSIETHSKSGFACAIQQVGQTWGAVPLHIDANKNFLLLPGLNTSGDIAHMCEKKNPAFIDSLSCKPQTHRQQRFKDISRTAYS